jgi:hypothetical protein
MLRRLQPCSALLLVAAVAACQADDAEATLHVSIYGEALIEEGIGPETFVDGWAVSFSTFLVAVSDISTGGTHDEDAYLLSLTTPSMGEGHAVTELLVPAGTDHLEYRIGPQSGFSGGNAGPDAEAKMVADGASIHVEGRATRGTETVDFVWTFGTDTTYAQCELAEAPAADTEGSAQLTIHADHLFYDDLDSEEPNVAFDLPASGDADGDGMLTIAELGAVDITGQTRYQVGSRNITNLAGFIAAQSMTMGHIDGEGHCESGAPG